MHKTHIFEEKNILPTYLTYFFQTVTGNKQYFSLGLMSSVVGALYA